MAREMIVAKQPSSLPQLRRQLADLDAAETRKRQRSELIVAAIVLAAIFVASIWASAQIMIGVMP